MENYTDIIDLLNAYINKTLTEAERLAFENRLQTDTEFNSLYTEQVTIIEGIKRVELTREIQAAKQSHIRAKWMKYIGVSFGVILISLVVYSFIFKTETPQVTIPQNNNEIEIVSDSIEVEKPLEEKIKEETIIKETEIETVSNETINAKVVKEVNKSIVEKKALDDIISEEKPISKAEEKQVILESEPITPDLKTFFKSVKKAPQIIEVNTEKDFTVTCKEGTKLTIPAKSFVEVKTGKLARGIINLEVTEYYKLSDMLLANLSTKSDDKQLETGGMLYLDANKKGKKLKLKSGKRIKMTFVNKGKKDMQLFTGVENNEGVNWKLEDQLNTIIPKKKRKPVRFNDPIIEEDVEVAFNVIDEVPVFQKCSEKEDNYARRDCMNNAILKYVESKFNTSIAESLGITGANDVNTFFEIGKDGTIGEVRVRASNVELGNEMIRVIESMPKFIPGKQNGRAVKTTYYLPFEITFKGITVRQQLVTVKNDRKFINKVKSQLDSTGSATLNTVIATDDIARYAFATSKLGWINCDRFARTTSQKIKYKLKFKDSKGANVKMVFKSISSILPSSKRNDNFEFGWVPKDEDVVLIAIKQKDNKFYLGKKDIKTSRVLKQDIDFKEVTIQELKQELQALNNSF